MELCRYVVLNPVRVKRNMSAAAWKWSSYRATAGLAAVPKFLTTDWVLAYFDQRRSAAQKKYRKFVKEGLESRPWEGLKGQIYLGSEELIARHSVGNDDLKEVPRAQLHATRPPLEKILAKGGERAILPAYREHGYRLHEIAEHLGVHYATVSRRLKRMEQRDEGNV